MSVPFLPHVSQKQMDSFRVGLNRVTLSDVLEHVRVKEKFVVGGSSAGCSRGRQVALRFEFLPRKTYKDRFGVSQEGVLKYFETKFIHKVLLLLVKE